MVSCAQQDRTARREPAHNYLDDAGMLGGHRMMLACHMPFLPPGSATDGRCGPAGGGGRGSWLAATDVRSRGRDVHRLRGSLPCHPSA